MPSVTFTPSPWFVKLGDRVSWRDCRAFTYPKFQVILAVFQDVHQHKCLAVTWLLSLRKIPPVIITWQNADETRLEKSYRDWPRPRRSTVWSQQQTCSLAINRLAEGLWVWTALWIFVSTMPKMTNTIIACVYAPKCLYGIFKALMKPDVNFGLCALWGNWIFSLPFMWWRFILYANRAVPLLSRFKANPRVGGKGSCMQ